MILILRHGILTSEMNEDMVRNYREAEKFPRQRCKMTTALIVSNHRRGDLNDSNPAVSLNLTKTAQWSRSSHRFVTPQTDYLNPFSNQQLPWRIAHIVACATHDPVNFSFIQCFFRRQHLWDSRDAVNFSRKCHLTSKGISKIPSSWCRLAPRGCT